MYGEILGAFYQNGFVSGRMISHSKSGYMKRNPGNEVYFNANIFVLDEGKIWWGDLDLTNDKPLLEKISNECGKKLYILRELDGRFENDDANIEHVLKYAIAVIG